MPHTVENLMTTSVYACRCSLPFVTDLELLQRLLEACAAQEGHKTRAHLVARRIAQLRRGED